MQRAEAHRAIGKKVIMSKLLILLIASQILHLNKLAVVNANELQQQQQFEANHQQNQPPSSTTTSNTNLRYSSNTNTENIAIGNTNTNNYNFQQSSYLPTQLTQVVLNVPKPKKLRISRPPTEEEFAIKRKLLEVYEGARRDVSPASRQSINLDHLGRILLALNPKYIATERVRRVAFGNPADPTTLLPLPDVQPQPLSTISLKVDGSVPDQLDQLATHFKSQVTWELQFVELLANTDDNQLNSQQLAFKKLLLCLTQPAFCPKPESNSFIIRQNEQQQQDLLDQPEVAASQMNQVYAPAPQQFAQTPVVQENPPRTQQTNYYTQNQLPFYRQQANNRNPLRFRTRYSPPKWIYRGPQANNNNQ